MAFGSCRFLFCQFIQWDNARKVMADVETLYPVPVALVRRFRIDCEYHFMQSIRESPHTAVISFYV